MRVLVMGGSRFNGLALVRELARCGHEVTVLNRGQTDAVFPRGVRRLSADRNDSASLRDALGTGDYDVVHDVSGYTLAQVRSAVELLKGRIAHYIFASSTVGYAAARLLPIRETHADDRTERQGDYARNKLDCEDYLFDLHRREGFPATTVPFSMVFGPNNIVPDREQRMFQRLLQGRPVFVPGDGTTLGMVGHVDDQARALRMMMMNPVTFGKRYNLTGNDAYSDEGYVDTFAEVLGVEPRRIHVPAAVMDELWAASGPALHQAAHLIQKVAPHIHRWNSSVIFSIDRLRADIGWEPEYTFRSMVEQTYDWYCSAGLDRTGTFDFSFEDQLLERLGSS
ncbi:MAG: NAD-dependent epimerase/dehydratase family protein [Dehalococcoidia bacterium]|nr:NAD-dependent epimerase/dehydratase family protein [Dehalococcoidia bacterium]MCA9828859.1 NAD-dependent epimerase/dehydratase family protein [Dehalococcoidia bacterium]MCB9486147.1 NAD-dependent epimerase/dehydratase family protein [Thermoflexaceae bacterium]